MPDSPQSKPDAPASEPFTATASTTITLPWSPDCRYEPLPVTYWVDGVEHQGHEGYWCTAHLDRPFPGCPNVTVVYPPTAQ